MSVNVRASVQVIWRQTLYNLNAGLIGPPLIRRADVLFL